MFSHISNLASSQYSSEYTATFFEPAWPTLCHKLLFCAFSPSCYKKRAKIFYLQNNYWRRSLEEKRRSRCLLETFCNKQPFLLIVERLPVVGFGFRCCSCIGPNAKMFPVLSQLNACMLLWYTAVNLHRKACLICHSCSLYFCSLSAMSIHS